MSCALTGRPVVGASAEYADAEGLSGFMPLDLLDAPESEARAVTPGPADETVANTRPTVPFAFARTDAAALGIAMPMVAAGEAHYPALTTAPPAGPKAADAAASQTAAAFTLTKREPKRITGQFLIRVEDIALMPSMERDLRLGIASAMADSLDGQVINGSGGGANLAGLFSVATDVNVAGATETFSTAIVRFAGVVDGKHANGFGDIRALIGVATFAKYAAIFANADKGDISAYDHLMSKLGTLRVSTRVPGKSNNGQKAYSRPDGATSTDHRPDLEGRGIDRRSVHGSREGPADRDGGNDGRFAVRALRDRPGYRGSPEDLLSAEPIAGACWFAGKSAVAADSWTPGSSKYCSDVTAIWADALGRSARAGR